MFYNVCLFFAILALPFTRFSFFLSLVHCIRFRCFPQLLFLPRPFPTLELFVNRLATFFFPPNSVLQRRIFFMLTIFFYLLALDSTFWAELNCINHFAHANEAEFPLPRLALAPQHAIFVPSFVLFFCQFISQCLLKISDSNDHKNDSYKQFRINRVFILCFSASEKASVPS